MCPTKTFSREPTPESAPHARAGPVFLWSGAGV